MTKKQIKKKKRKSKKRNMKKRTIQRVEQQLMKPTQKKDQENGKYPCGTCKVDVTDEGIECQRCKLWFHFGPCSEVDELEDYRKENKNKKYKCTECEKEKGKKKKKS